MASGTQNLRPLSGIKIVEAAAYHAAPGASAVLAELGAEVIKIENPQGDPLRYGRRQGVDPLRTNDVNTDDWTVVYDLANKGKRGISVDLRYDEGQQILQRLVANADVFLTNMPPASRPGLGTDYETVSAANSRLVYVSLTAFGTEGPMSSLNGFDSLAQE